MTESTAHPLATELVALLLGDRDGAADTDALLAHVERCELCLERCERIWTETSPLGAGPPAEMGPEVATRIERTLLARTQSIQMAEDVTVFASHGVLAVMLGLLAPFLAVFSPTLADTARKNP